MKVSHKLSLGLGMALVLQPAILPMQEETYEDAQLLATLRFNKRLRRSQLTADIPSTLKDIRHQGHVAATLEKNAKSEMARAAAIIDQQEKQLEIAKSYQQLQKERERLLKVDREQYTAELTAIEEDMERLGKNTNRRPAVLYDQPFYVYQSTKGPDGTTVERVKLACNYNRSDLIPALERHILEKLVLIQDSAPLKKGDDEQNKEKLAQLWQALHQKYKYLNVPKEQLQTIEQGCTVVEKPAQETVPAAETTLTAKKSSWWFGK